jgi:TRAP-type C4-dicarboxylate transport system permease small subunit
MMASTLRRCLDRLYLVTGWLAGLFLVAIFFLMLVLAGGRPVGFNIPAGDDFVAFCMVAMAFLGLAHTLRAGDMIRLNLLIDRLGPRARRVAELIVLVLGTAFVGYFTWSVLRLTYDSWRFNEMAQGVVAVPLWIPQLGFSLGLVVFLIVLVDEFVHVLRGGAPRYEKPKPKTAEEVIERAIESGT